MDKKELKKWNEEVLNEIARLIYYYEIMNGTTIDGIDLVKPKVKFDGLNQYTKNSIRSNK